MELDLADSVAEVDQLKRLREDKEGADAKRFKSGSISEDLLSMACMAQDLILPPPAEHLCNMGPIHPPTTSVQGSAVSSSATVTPKSVHASLRPKKTKKYSKCPLFGEMNHRLSQCIMHNNNSSKLLEGCLIHNTLGHNQLDCSHWKNNMSTEEQFKLIIAKRRNIPGIFLSVDLTWQNWAYEVLMKYPG
ncbi:hypothetical protein S7711_10622 [Stachybotrys chartarum IBT 7711]|uniref:Uncharacterized protein n=1 Tax=Stachybotrys chartarum (strain CBS 109288 / IBT 7711) TaxID=1280523 RepID=A0A084AZ52_STACB|nr:hypothetical protein S7711_10622 [Stachybotrys chartarum IBT 7711]